MLLELVIQLTMMTGNTEQMDFGVKFTAQIVHLKIKDKFFTDEYSITNAEDIKNIYTILV